MENQQLLTEILIEQVRPALGCTEPGAVALAVARCRELLGEPVRRLSVSVDKNVLKNGMDVGIPGTDARGIVFAAALSLVAGKPEYGLEVLRDAGADDIARASDLVADKVVSLALDEQAGELTIRAVAQGDFGQATVVIRREHTNIVYEARNGEVLLDCSCAPAAPGDKTNPPQSKKQQITRFRIKEMFDYATQVDLPQIAFLGDGIEMNRRIAEVGISQDVGVGLGRFLYAHADSLADRAKALTAAASEARMSGWPLPVMSSAGSGNHGLVAILPISVIGEGLACPRERILRAVAFSHLVTVFIKAYLGTLSPVCGCGVAAGVGCAAGLVFLQGGDARQAGAAVNNMMAGIAGMICDGAKLGCSYKLSVAVDAAVDAARMALEDICIPPCNGILGATPEDTVRNFAKVSTDGMDHTDSIILDVMLRQCV